MERKKGYWEKCREARILLRKPVVRRKDGNEKKGG